MITHRIRGTDCSLLKTNAESACCIPIPFSNMQSTNCKPSIRSLYKTGYRWAVIRK